VGFLSVARDVSDFPFVLEPASFCTDDTNGDIRNDIGQCPNWCEQAENHNHEHGECEATAKLGPLKYVARLATVEAYIITTMAISIAAITAGTESLNT
jgi:hypothetical protein